MISIFIGCVIVQYIYLKYIFIPYDDRFFMTYLIYFILGCILAEDVEFFRNKIRKYSPFIYICFAFFTYWHVTHAYYANVYGIIYKNWRIFTCLFSISAIAAFYHISYFITRIMPKLICIFKVLDASSLYIFLGHCYVLYCCNEHWFKVGMDSILRKFVLNSILVFFISFFVSFLYVLCKKNISKNK